MEIPTRSGAALADVDGSGPASCLVVLTHGAGGGPGSPDLLAVAQACLGLGAVVARVTQPYRVRGARAPGSAARQDADWMEIIAALRQAVPGVPLIQGGRSNGARVACRTARAVAARGVIALAFPLHPPGRPERSREGELRSAGTDVLVINGDRDPFGVPPAGGPVRVAVLPGESHALSRRPGQAGRVAAGWLRELLAGGGAAGRVDGRADGGAAGRVDGRAGGVADGGTVGGADRGGEGGGPPACG